jgi:hypothetical protein
MKSSDKFMIAAIEEAKKGFAEGGIPISPPALCAVVQFYYMAYLAL